jgi:hypothetical protein
MERGPEHDMNMDDSVDRTSSACVMMYQPHSTVRNGVSLSGGKGSDFTTVLG